MGEIFCQICFHNCFGNCNENSENYMVADSCDKFLENEDIGPLVGDLGDDYFGDGIS